MIFALSLVMVACEKSETDGMLDATLNASITPAESVDIADIECKYWKYGIKVLERYDSDGNAIEIEPDMAFAGGTQRYITLRRMASLSGTQRLLERTPQCAVMVYIVWKALQ